MIRIEPESSLSPFMMTTEQFIAASAIITDSPQFHYDLVENRYKRAGITTTRLHLWTWPADRSGTPTRTWIDEDGEVSLVEDCDWIGDDEWPAWVEPTTTEETPS